LAAHPRFLRIQEFLRRFQDPTDPRVWKVFRFKGKTAQMFWATLGSVSEIDGATVPNLYLLIKKLGGSQSIVTRFKQRGLINPGTKRAEVLISDTTMSKIGEMFDYLGSGDSHPRNEKGVFSEPVPKNIGELIGSIQAYLAQLDKEIKTQEEELQKKREERKEVLRKISSLVRSVRDP